MSNDLEKNLDDEEYGSVDDIFQDSNEEDSEDDVKELNFDR